MTIWVYVSSIIITLPKIDWGKISIPMFVLTCCIRTLMDSYFTMMTNQNMPIHKIKN